MNIYLKYYPHIRINLVILCNINFNSKDLNSEMFKLFFYNLVKVDWFSDNALFSGKAILLFWKVKKHKLIWSQNYPFRSLTSLIFFLLLDNFLSTVVLLMIVLVIVFVIVGFTWKRNHYFILLLILLFLNQGINLITI